jgi:hypothetical protein
MSMDEFDLDEPMYDTDQPPCLTIELPLEISDEAALQITNLLMAFHDAFCSHFDDQIRRAVLARMRVKEEIWREQQELRLERDRLSREQQFRAVQLNLPFDEDDVPF